MGGRSAVRNIMNPHTEQLVASMPEAPHDPVVRHAQGASWNEARLETTTLPSRAYAKIKLHELPPPDPVYNGMKEYLLVTYLTQLFGDIQSRHSPAVPLQPNLRIFDSCTSSRFELLFTQYLKQEQGLAASIMFTYTTARSNRNLDHITLDQWILGIEGQDYQSRADATIIPFAFLQSLVFNNISTSPARQMFFQTVVQHRVWSDTRRSNSSKKRKTEFGQNMLFQNIVRILKHASLESHPWFR